MEIRRVAREAVSELQVARRIGPSGRVRGATHRGRPEANICRQRMEQDEEGVPSRMGFRRRPSADGQTDQAVRPAVFALSPRRVRISPEPPRGDAWWAHHAYPAQARQENVRLK